MKKLMQNYFGRKEINLDWINSDSDMIRIKEDSKGTYASSDKVWIKCLDPKLNWIWTWIF